MQGLRSFDKLGHDPPSQLCPACSVLRAEWLNTVSKNALAKLRFDSQKPTHLVNAELEAFRRYATGRRQCKLCNKRFMSRTPLVESSRKQGSRGEWARADVDDNRKFPFHRTPGRALFFEMGFLYHASSARRKKGLVRQSLER